jgi:hypothetical protein
MLAVNKTDAQIPGGFKLAWSKSADIKKGKASATTQALPTTKVPKIHPGVS